MTGELDELDPYLVPRDEPVGNVVEVVADNLWLRAPIA
jgi:hypothetical protein